MNAEKQSNKQQPVELARVPESLETTVRRPVVTRKIADQRRHAGRAIAVIAVLVVRCKPTHGNGGSVPVKADNF